MDYPVESFTAAERELLRPHFTNLDLPVFALTNLPEAVKGALFARYSRYPGTLRRLFLDEFADSLPKQNEGYDSDEGQRAADIYDRVFVGYGDDSVAQLGGVHVACEWSSNLLTKILQRPRLGSYLEQSTRYIAYDVPMDEAGHWRYYRDASLGPEYEQAMDELFRIYSATLADMEVWMAQAFPRTDEPEGPWRRAVRAKALDACRGLLPAGALSHMGIYASGQTYEQLVLHLLAHPAVEARECGQMMLTELQKVIPSFVARVERPERGGVWVDFLRERREREEQLAAGLHTDDDQRNASVRLLSCTGDEDALLAALLFERSHASETKLLAAVQTELSDEEKKTWLAQLLGNRENRRHRPGRGLESLTYRFEIVSDYGAFRDLQRHRLLTCQWQELTPQLGADIPEDITAAGLDGAYQRALDVSARAFKQLRADGHEFAAGYAVCLAYRMRYILDMNAREATHLIELRSGKEGHPSYRAVALAMREQIAKQHPAVAQAMVFTDETTDPRLERIASEIRSDRGQETA